MSAVPNQWKTAPIGGEFTSGLSMAYMLDDNREDTIAMLTQSHTSFIGPKVPTSTDARLHREGVDAVKLAMGYRLRVAHAKLLYTNAKSYSLMLRWVNDGVAPFYRDWPVKLYAYDDRGRRVATFPVDIKLSKLVDATVVVNVTKFSLDALPGGVYTLGVGIADPALGLPAVQLAMEEEIEENVYFLGEVQKEL